MKRVTQMRIGVVSDTHRNKSSIEQLGGKIGGLDMLIHLFYLLAALCSSYSYVYHLQPLYAS